MSLTPDQEAWIDRARGTDILDVALRPPIGAKLKRQGREHVGACPRCGGEDRFAINPKKNGGVFVCRGSGDGGDVIEMVRHVLQADFKPACEVILGEPFPPAIKGPVDPEERKRWEAEQQALAEKRAAERAELDARRKATEDREREKARQSAYGIWQRGLPFAGSIAETYLRECRGIKELPDRLQLRFVPDLAYCHGEVIDDRGYRSARVVHRGPAMLAPIVEPLTGKFRAVHRTYIDLDRPKGKALILDPDTGKELKVKKGLGSKETNVVRLHQMSEKPHTLFMGEGIETVLSVWYAVLLDRRRKADSVAMTSMLFWCAVDLGNIAGKASATVPHPTNKDKGGRPTRMAGPEPLLTSQGIAIPDSIEDVVLLGDGDSDRFTTQCALCRATKRFALNSEMMTKIGRTVRTAWAPDGMDFNDLLRAA